MTAWTRAKELLVGERTCVLCKGDVVKICTQRGVKPLLSLFESGEDFQGCYAADKVVGKATAFLYALLGARGVYAKVLSENARTVLQKQGILVEYGELVPHIINRSGVGICPFEEAVLGVEDTQAAYEIIRKKMQELRR